MLTEPSHALPTVHANSIEPKFCDTLSPTGCPPALSGVHPQEEVAVMKPPLVVLAVSTSLQSGTAAQSVAGKRGARLGASLRHSGCPDRVTVADCPQSHADGGPCALGWLTSQRIAGASTYGGEA